MGVDYYKVLQVDRRANNDDIKAKFKNISEAYNVLSDPQKRAVYDQYGEAGLKGNVPPPNAAAGPSPSRFNQRSADEMFTEIFGDSYFSTADGPSSSRFIPRSEDDIFAEFFGGSSPFGGGSGGARKSAPIEKKLSCSLDDLYKGTTKKMKISREIVDVTGKTKQMEEILTIVVKPGWKTGTKITFAEKGNEHPGVIPSDLVFIIEEKPHLVFTREGDDLLVTKKISLADVLTGYTVNLTTLDGRTLTIPVTNVIHPEYEEVVPKEGMPLQKDQTKKGNLRIKFTIKFPARFTAEQKAGFKKLVG